MPEDNIQHEHKHGVEGRISRARLIQLPNLGEGLKPLSGIMLTLCSACSKSKDDEEQWSELEEYLKNHLDADLSHSLCPECAKQMYPELFKSEDE